MKKSIKIAYFHSATLKNKVLTSNGKVLDNFCTSCKTNENLLTGNYTMDAIFLLEAQEYLEKENILKVKLDYGDEIFRISKIDVGTRYVTIVARQITIPESLTLYLEDVRPTGKSGQGALTELLNGATGIKEITLTSNISTINTAYYQDMSLYKALHDSDNSFQNEWGGEVLRRGYNITINASIGTNRGVSIREAKNLTGFNGGSNIDGLVTRARGKGFNGIKGTWIDSPLIYSYARVYTQTLEYSDVKVKGESDEEGFDTLALAQTELDRRINLEFSENDIDKMKATYDISFVQLEKTEEYKNYIQAERAYIGDTIRVYVPKIKTDIKVRAVEKNFDILAQKVNELILSNVVVLQAMSSNTILADIKKQLNNTSNNSMASYIDSVIKSGMKNSYLVVRDNELLAMDSKDINTATTVARFNKNGLGFSSNGYYGEYTYGFTLDGVINASLISTGVLSAILIQSMDGLNYFDLETGKIHFNKGLIEGASSSWNLDTGIISFTKGLIKGSNSSWDLDTGEISFKKGLITGPNLEIDLTTGVIKVTHVDGSYTRMDSNGLKRYDASTERSYHYMMYSGSVSNIETQSAIRINVPAEFIGTDYKVDWWSGNVFPADPADLLFSANSEWVREDKAAGWFEVKASIMVRNPTTENSPVWRGKMNILYTIIA